MWSGFDQDKPITVSTWVNAQGVKVLEWGVGVYVGGGGI